MSEKSLWLRGSADEVGEKLQESYDRMLESTRRWAEIISFDPDPQTGMTPKDVVWRKNKSKLYRYCSSHGTKYRTPILILYALINKAYILDLTPGMSLVEYLVDEGFDVYMLEWGDFQWEDRHLTFADMIFDYIAHAVRKVCQFSQCDELSLIGYCMGGTMAAMYASLFSLPKIKNIIFLAAPFDFEDAGISSKWLKSGRFDADKIADTFELVPRDFIDHGVKMLNPVNNFWGTYTRLWKVIDEGMSIKSWKVLNKWVNDNTNFPGGTYRQWIQDMYQENLLIKGKMTLRGQTVDLKNIESALLVLAGEKDHIVLPQQARAALDYMGGQDKSYHEFSIGHGGLVFGGIARTQVFPTINRWLGERS
jgi:polyhydroxyalkanoate synthase